MDTLEKIDQIRQRLGVTYEEAYKLWRNAMVISSLP